MLETINLTDKSNKEIIEQFGKSKDDSGTSEVQIAILTKRIVSLTTHLKTNKKDNHTKYGLLKLVNRRKKLLDYLRKNEKERYQKILAKLGLRK